MSAELEDITTDLQDRIDELAATGGGELVVPRGRWRFSTLRLRSHLTLVLPAGCELVASSERSDYAPIGIDHNEMGAVTSMLWASEASHITLRGEGILNLNGEAFFHMDRPQTPFDEAPRSFTWRVNQPIFFHQCRHLAVSGLTILQSPCWTLTFDRCQGIQVRDLTIENSLVIPNNDGLHFSASRDIVVSGCRITAGDDCVALSGITDWDTPCENIVITNCLFQSASKALSIGYMHSIVRDVVISNVLVRRSNRAFVIMVHPGTGLVENVRVSDCLLEGRHYQGNWWGNGEALVIMATPHHNTHYRDPQPAKRFQVAVQGVHFSKVTCRAERPLALWSDSTDGAIRDVTMTDLEFTEVPSGRESPKGPVIDLSPATAASIVPGPGWGLVVRHAEVRLSGVSDNQGQTLQVVQLA